MSSEEKEVVLAIDRGEVVEALWKIFKEYSTQNQTYHDVAHKLSEPFFSC